ncbi:MAG: cytochrome c3 family protein [Verrucomicrobiota bacterium]
MPNFFPRWTNLLPLKLAVCLVLIGGGVVLAVSYYWTPRYSRVGYQPQQPIPYDHSLHVGQLGMDCRYCHTHVDESSHSNIPSAQTCWNCHQHVKTNSTKLEPLRRAVDESYENYDGKPIEWKRIHKVPDYAHFNHAAHVNRGVSCVSCHGKVNEMEVVWHEEPLTMGWCLDCHREPEKHLRPLEAIYDLDWKPENANIVVDGKKLETQREIGLHLKEHWNIVPPESCGACHY